MAAMDGFRQSFPLIILFLLLLILYLSMSFIRKNLEPLKRLTEGTRRVAERDFSRRVEITSNDEFEDLGHAFNEMTGQLDKQFAALQLLPRSTGRFSPPSTGKRFSPPPCCAPGNFSAVPRPFSSNIPGNLRGTSRSIRCSAGGWRTRNQLSYIQ
jgi:HAMP domain-containing protein